MSYIVSHSEVKVGQIWELRGGSVWIKITGRGGSIKGICVRPGVPNGGMRWEKDEENIWCTNGVFWYNNPGPHDLFKLVQDIDHQEPIVLTPQEPIVLTRAVETQDGLTCVFFTTNSPEGSSGSCTRNGKVEYEVWDQYGVAKINPMNTLKYRIKKDEGFVIVGTDQDGRSRTFVFLDSEFDSENAAREFITKGQQLLHFFYEDGKIVKVDVLT